MSVRTAWEIAALEDVRLAPSPRQQRPTPAPCVRRPPPHPSRAPSQGPRHCRQARGAPQLGPVFLSSRLFCSFSALPTPTCRTQVGRSLGPSGFLPVTSPSPSPGHKSWGVCPTAEPGPARATLMPQPQAAEDSPGFLPQGLRHAPRAGVAKGPAGGGVGEAPTTPNPHPGPALRDWAPR